MSAKISRSKSYHELAISAMYSFTFCLSKFEGTVLLVNDAKIVVMITIKSFYKLLITVKN